MNNHKFKSSIKNPLLKQIGSKSNVYRNDKDTVKINLEYLLDFLKINIKTPVINSPKINTNDEIHDPELGEFVNLQVSSINSNLDEIIDGIEFKRYGVIKSVIGKLNFYKNLSFLSSLATCINDKFVSLDSDTQINYLKSLKLYIYQTFTKEFYNFNNYKLLEKSFGFNKLTISKNLYNYDLTQNEILAISDMFHINIFIIDIAKDKLFFTGLNFVPFKKNIFLLKKEDDFYEPLNYNNNFYMNHTEDFINYLIENNNRVDLIFKLTKDSTFEIYNEPFEKYINFYNKDVKLDIKNKILERKIYNINKTKELSDNIITNNSDNSDNSDNSETEINNDYTENKNIVGFNEITEIKSLSDLSNDDSYYSSDEEIEKKYTKSELIKLKLQELVLIAKSLHISADYVESDKKKKKTKNMLIEEIIKN